MGRGACPALGSHFVSCLRQGTGWWRRQVAQTQTGSGLMRSLGRWPPILALLWGRGPCSLLPQQRLCLVQDSMGAGLLSVPGEGASLLTWEGAIPHELGGCWVGR